MADDLRYENPLITRYAERKMAERWGNLRKFQTWRRLWLALAEGQYELGLTAEDGVTPRIRAEQLEQLRSTVETINFASAEAHEKRLRHDVMAHIHAWGEQVPAARDIIHLGATSCFVTDNTDLLLMRESLEALAGEILVVIDLLASFAAKWRSEPTLGYTHFQPAQLTTVGKRAALWCHDWLLDLYELDYRVSTLRFRGAKGTTGTQAGFLALFRGDHEKVKQLDLLVARKMGFDEVYPVTGQTYSRKIDTQVLDVLAGIGQTGHKWGSDLRLLAHEQEIDEPFESEQVGSSAMPYKRNPMRAERMCALSRFLIHQPTQAADTAASQWLERTLDDSAIRRLYLPQAFLAASGVLRLAMNLAGGLIVNQPIIARHVAEALPYMATENLLMAGVAQGGNRQDLHEVIRRHSQAVTAELKAGRGRSTDLLKRLAAEDGFRGVDFAAIMNPRQFIGRAAEQVEEFIAAEITPLRERFRIEADTIEHPTV